MLPGFQKNTFLSFILTFFVIILISLIAFEIWVINDKRIIQGVYVKDINLSGKTITEAEVLLAPFYQEVLAREIILAAGSSNWFYQASGLGVGADPQKTIQIAMAIGRKGFIWQRWNERRQAWFQRKKISPEFHIDEDKIKKELLNIGNTVNQEPVNALLEITVDNKVKINPAVDGFKLDIEKSVQTVTEVLLDPERNRVVLVVASLKPELTTVEVKNWQINGAIASYYTNFDPGKADRSYNIKMAAQALNQCLVQGRDFFSFNDTVGPRTKESGYKEGIVIENNRFTPGVGGGVCQVSSTLYNAVLRANLTIIERVPHSIPVGYVPPGLDATVAYDWADLIFLNNLTTPILLHTEYSAGKIGVIIFGPVDAEPEVRIFSRVVREIKPEQEIIKDYLLPPGTQVVEKEGHSGMEVEVTREVRKAGKTIISEVISRDIYKPVNGVVRVAPQDSGCE